MGEAQPGGFVPSPVVGDAVRPEEIRQFLVACRTQHFFARFAPGPGLLLCGAAHLPALFLPSFARVLSAVRHFMLWVTLVLTFRYFIKNYSHEYDKKTLAYSLFLVPMIMLGVSLGLIVVGLLR